MCEDGCSRCSWVSFLHCFRHDLLLDDGLQLSPCVEETQDHWIGTQTSLSLHYKALTSDLTSQLFSIPGTLMMTVALVMWMISGPQPITQFYQWSVSGWAPFKKAFPQFDIAFFLAWGAGVAAR